jgi:acetolactate synthase-1/2/3 large subunit
VEGDGGFAQNVQELGTVAVNNLNLKIFIFHDQGHASIRMTQRNYFNGKYLGCDRPSGLGLPDWIKLFPAWDVPVMALPLDFENDPEFQARMSAEGLPPSSYQSTRNKPISPRSAAGLPPQDQWNRTPSTG